MEGNILRDSLTKHVLISFIWLFLLMKLNKKPKQWHQTVLQQQFYEKPVGSGMLHSWQLNSKQ